MKKYFLVLGVVVAMISCTPIMEVNSVTCLPRGWEPMDRQLVEKYFVGLDTVLYYKADFGGVLKLNRSYEGKRYSSSFCDKGLMSPGTEALGVEEYFINYKYETSDYKFSLDFGLRLSQRSWLDFSYSFHADRDNIGWCQYELERDNAKDQGMGWPRNPEAYKAYFTDRIQLKNASGTITGELVAGKGLAWFTDDKGVKWTLQ